MSRGYCYEISTDPCLYPIGLLTPDEVADDKPYGIYSAIVPDNCPAIVHRFIDSLIEAGAIVCEMTDEDYEDSISFGALAVIEFPPDFRERYFRDAYQALKRDVDKLSLTEFATDGGKAAFLSQLLDDETELVYFNSSYYTVDEFVRQVMPNTRYFIAKDNVLITD